MWRTEPVAVDLLDVLERLVVLLEVHRRDPGAELLKPQASPAHGDEVVRGLHASRRAQVLGKYRGKPGDLCGLFQCQMAGHGWHRRCTAGCGPTRHGLHSPDP